MRKSADQVLEIFDVVSILRTQSHGKNLLSPSVYSQRKLQGNVNRIRLVYSLVIVGTG